MRASLSALSTDSALLSRNIICLLLVIISVRDLVNPRGLVRLKGIYELKKVIYLIGSQTRDLPSCSYYSNVIEQEWEDVY
jgi:hypothetical protein